MIKGSAWLVDHGRSGSNRQLHPEAAFRFAFETAAIIESIDYTIFCRILPYRAAGRKSLSTGGIEAVSGNPFFAKPARLRRWLADHARS